MNLGSERGACSMPGALPSVLEAGAFDFPLSCPAGGRALIPKNAFGWPILARLFFARVGSFSSLVSNFHFSIFQV
jgi:hypothetical protein